MNLTVIVVKYFLNLGKLHLSFDYNQAYQDRTGMRGEPGHTHTRL